MTRIKKYLLPVVGVFLLAMFALNIVRYLTSPSPERVRAEDREVGARVVPGTDDAEAGPTAADAGQVASRTDCVRDS